MGCCAPEFKELADEKEKEVNDKGRDQIPMLIKVGLGILTLIGIGLAIGLS